MPLYKVKPNRTIEHENRCYFENEMVELPSYLGAFHEPNIVPYVVPESITSTVEDTNNKEDSETASINYWYDNARKS